jgi:hypothetical protein
MVWDLKLTVVICQEYTASDVMRYQVNSNSNSTGTEEVTALDHKYRHNGSVKFYSVLLSIPRYDSVSWMRQCILIWHCTYKSDITTLTSPVLTTLQVKRAYVSEDWALGHDSVSLGEMHPTFWRYCRSQWPTDTLSYPRGPESSATPLWEPKVLH